MELILRALDGVGTESLINKIIKDVDLMSVIDKIPNGIETILSPEFGGIDLSAGQWQKVALSRALYHDGDIVIMDEPTAMMDAKMEHRMFQIYKDLFRDKTTVIISHRFSNVKNCDIIFVMKDGFLIETGSHNDLIELNKIYKEMYEIQKTMYDNFEKPENAENYNELDGLFKRGGKI